MKHHEYQIYYGGFKKHLPYIYCSECNKIIHYKNLDAHKILLHPKKQSNNVPCPKRKGHSPIALRKQNER